MTFLEDKTMEELKEEILKSNTTEYLGHLRDEVKRRMSGNSSLQTEYYSLLIRARVNYLLSKGDEK